MPLGKKRVFPDWMIGAGKRVGVGEKKKKKKETPVVIEVSPPSKVSHRVAAPRSTTKIRAKR